MSDLLQIIVVVLLSCVLPVTTGNVLAVLMGNVLAVATHGFSWVLRRKCMWLLIAGGVIGFIGFSGIVWFFFYFHGLAFDGFTPEEEAQNAIEDAAAPLRIFLTIGISVLITGIIGLMHKKQIPSPWWKASLAFWGEMTLWMLSLGIVTAAWGWVPFNIPNFLYDKFIGAFVLTLIAMALFRPFISKLYAQILQMRRDWFRLK